MTQSSGAPRGGADVVEINNPHLPEGFKITEEMRKDPVVMFFLKNYHGAIRVRVFTGTPYEGYENIPFFLYSDGTCSGAPLQAPVISGGLDIDFFSFNFETPILLLAGQSIDSEYCFETDPFNILRQFIPEDKRSELRELYDQDMISFAQETSNRFNDIIQ